MNMIVSWLQNNIQQVTKTLFGLQNKSVSKIMSLSYHCFSHIQRETHNLPQKWDYIYKTISFKINLSLATCQCDKRVSIHIFSVPPHAISARADISHCTLLVQPPVPRWWLVVTQACVTRRGVSLGGPGLGSRDQLRPSSPGCNIGVDWQGDAVIVAMTLLCNACVAGTSCHY